MLWIQTDERPSTGIANLSKIFTEDFGHKICLKAFSMQNIFSAFDCSRIRAAQLNR